MHPRIFSAALVVALVVAAAAPPPTLAAISADEAFARLSANVDGLFDWLCVGDDLNFADGPATAARLGTWFAPGAQLALSGDSPFILEDYLGAARDGLYSVYGANNGRFCASRSTPVMRGLAQGQENTYAFVRTLSFSTETCGGAVRIICYGHFDDEGQIASINEAIVGVDTMTFFGNILANACDKPAPLSPVAQAEYQLMLAVVENFMRAAARYGADAVAQFAEPEVAEGMRAFYSALGHEHGVATLIPVESARFDANTLAVRVHGNVFVRDGACAGSHVVHMIFVYTFGPDRKIADMSFYGGQDVLAKLAPCIKTGKPTHTADEL